MWIQDCDVHANQASVHFELNEYKYFKRHSFTTDKLSIKGAFHSAA